MLLDIFSRYVVGWLIADHESAALAYTPTPLRSLSQYRLERILLDELHRCANVEIAYGPYSGRQGGSRSRCG